ncbi:MAG: hypothetical protein IJI66_14060 [Erysipelotrichaceae bacterium]|nr:hypothetical protein [Erysipelotrichaceae bacterium]
MELKNIEFESMCPNEETRTTVMYFTGPAELLEMTGNEYPDAVMSTISIETTGIIFPEAENATVSISPTMEDNEGLHDYDWSDIEISKKEVEYLINVALINHYGIEPVAAAS